MRDEWIKAINRGKASSIRNVICSTWMRRPALIVTWVVSTRLKRNESINARLHKFTEASTLSGLPQVRKWSEVIIFKVREFCSDSGKIFNTAELYLWRLKETFRSLITTIFLLNEEGKFIENVSVLLNEWKGRPKVEARSRYYIWHVFLWSGKFYFYLGKVRKFEKWLPWLVNRPFL